MRSIVHGVWLVGLLSATLAAGDDPKRPNFIVFIADDMATEDCGAYGHPHIRTPNIDQLARAGMRFDRAFLTCSSCSPSRASILTGRYPHNTGAEQLHWPVPKSQILLSEPLRKAGYWTGSIGKWHLGDEVLDRFDRVETALPKWRQVLDERPRDKPFFVWFAFYDPHRPYQENTIPEPHRPEDAIVPPYLPDTPAVRADLAMYYDEIARLDGVMGDALALLAEQGAADNTFVLFMSDNGRPFPRAKTTVYDSGVQTPFIVKFPGQVKPGSTCKSLVSSIDIAPTILELAGVAPSPTFQGVSFAPLLRDPATKTRDYVFAEHNWHDYSAYDRAVRGTRFLYIRNGYTDLTASPPADAVRSPTFNEMQRLYAAGKLPVEQATSFVVPRLTEELYDTAADAHQLRNLVDDKQHAKTLAEMRGVLDEWQQATGDRMPPERTPDEFDRTTGESTLTGKREPRRPIPARRAEVDAR